MAESNGVRLWRVVQARNHHRLGAGETPGRRQGLRELRAGLARSVKSLHGHALRQIARLVHVTATSDGNVVREQLQRNDGE